MSKLPLERFHDLGAVPEAGYGISLTAGPEELRRLAEWAGIDEVSHLRARIEVRPESKIRYAIETEFEADIVQSCVVTLEPVRTRIARRFTRELQLTRGLHRFADRGGMVSPAASDDEAPDEIENPRYDLAAPLREEFALAIDPYPRAPGVALEPADEGRGQVQNPFTVLKKFGGTH